MAKTFAVLKAECLSELQDVNAAVWGLTPNTSEIEYKLEDAFREVSDYVPYLMQEVFKIESRTGTATSDTANALVDATKAQFLSTDEGKVIYNTDDKTWADVIAYVSTSQLTLSKDIMADGDEDYEMYNKNCRSNKEIYIGDITDFIGGNHGVIDDAYHPAEYPLGTKRNVDVSGDILTILMDDDPPDSDSTLTTLNDVEVFVWFKKRHRVSQLTDLLGAITATPAAGAITMAVDGFTGTEIIAEDTLFTIANMRGTYRTTQATTLTAGAGTIYFYPGLDKAGVATTVITVIGSTLDDRLERLVVELTAGKARMSKSGAFISDEFGGVLWRAHFDLGKIQYNEAIEELKAGRPVTIKATYSRL